MAKQSDPEPAAVPVEAKQAGPVPDPWGWTEPAVWTERMLTALQRGVKGGVWFSLIDKVYSLANLAAAWAKVQANAGASGVDGQTIEQFSQNAEWHLKELQAQLRQGSYQPQPVRRAWIDKPGSTEQRPLGIPAVRDRIVQTALRHVLEPIWEAEFAEHSYGFRPGRGCLDALRRVDELLKSGYTVVVDADLKGYFDSIPHDRLMAEVRRKVGDGRVLHLIEQYLEAKVMDGLEEWTPVRGTPQGAVISPLLSNLYLDELDHVAAAAGLAMVRYADDFVIMCRNEAEAKRALELVGNWVANRGLTLHPEKTRLVDTKQAGGFDFLGYHFERGSRWPRAKSLVKLKERIRELTPRSNGQSLQMVIGRINQVLRGWFGYFKHSNKATFGPLDGWIRMRLRSILRKRQKEKGRGRGGDHQRWPNAYFAEQGYFSLKEAHARTCRSRKGNY
jgi:RNA-directed DNA polymerase